MDRPLPPVPPSAPPAPPSAPPAPSRRDFLAASAGALLAASAAPSLASPTPLPSASLSFTSGAPRKIGTTDLMASPVGCGAMLTRDADVIRYAVDKGADYVDTADCYMGGENERIVGRALAGGLRKKVVLASKVHVSDPVTMVRSVENSLRSLGTDVIDLMQLHGVSTEAEVTDGPAREALGRLIREGKVRYAGVTTHSGQETVLAAVAKHGFYRTVLVAYSFRSAGTLTKAIQDASAAGVGIIAMKTQAGGYPQGAGSSLSPHQAALAWVLKNEAVVTAIPSMTAYSHVDDNLGARGKSFSWLDRRTLSAWEASLGDRHCSLCGRCAGSCGKGVDVPSVLRCLTYREGYGEEELARHAYRALPPPRSAAGCAGCARCTVRCRLGLPVGALTIRAHALLG